MTAAVGLVAEDDDVVGDLGGGDALRRDDLGGVIAEPPDEGRRALFGLEDEATRDHLGERATATAEGALRGSHEAGTVED